MYFNSASNSLEGPPGPHEGTHEAQVRLKFYNFIILCMREWKYK